MTRRKSKNFIPHAENRRSCDYGGVPVASLGTGDCGRLKVSECIKNIHIYTYNASKYVCSTYHTYINLSYYHHPLLPTYSLLLCQLHQQPAEQEGKGERGRLEKRRKKGVILHVS